MPDEMNEIVDHLSQPSAWVRILFMIVFAALLYLIIAPLILVLMIAQALFSVFGGESNRNLCYLGNALVTYVSQILSFVTYNSEDKPFPFSDFPAPSRDEETNPGRKSKPAARKTPRSKSPAGKKPAAGE